jgi:hypothetical protein
VEPLGAARPGTNVPPEEPLTLVRAGAQRDRSDGAEPGRARAPVLPPVRAKPATRIDAPPPPVDYEA